MEPDTATPRVDSDADDDVDTGVDVKRAGAAVQDSDVLSESQPLQPPGAGAAVQDSEEGEALRKAGHKTSRVSSNESKPVLSKTNEPAANNPRRHRPPRTIWVVVLLSVLVGKFLNKGRLFMMPNAQEAPKEAHMAVPRARTCVYVYNIPKPDLHTASPHTHAHSHTHTHTHTHTHEQPRTSLAFPMQHAKAELVKKRQMEAFEDGLLSISLGAQVLRADTTKSERAREREGEREGMRSSERASERERERGEGEGEGGRERASERVREGGRERERER